MDKRTKTSFEVGERVIYGHYGAGEIEALVQEEVDGMLVDLYQLKLDSGNTIKVAVMAAHREFRAEETTVDVERIISILNESPKARNGRWIHHERRLMARLKDANLIDLAEMVRDLHPRGRELAYGVQKMYQTALSQLTSRLRQFLGHKTVPETLRFLDSQTELEFRDGDAQGQNYVAQSLPKPRRARSQPKTAHASPAPKKQAKVQIPKSVPVKKKQQSAQSKQSVPNKKVSADISVPEKDFQEQFAKLQQEFKQSQAAVLEAKRENASLRKQLETAEKQRDRVEAENASVRAQRDRANAEWVTMDHKLKKQAKELQEAHRVHAEVKASSSAPPELKEIFGTLVLLTMLQTRALHEQTFATAKESKGHKCCLALQTTLDERSAELKAARRTVTMRGKKIEKLQKEIKDLKAFVRRTKQREKRDMEIVLAEINAVRTESLTLIEEFAKRRRLLK